jgi:hypothetical protein
MVKGQYVNCCVVYYGAAEKQSLVMNSSAFSEENCVTIWRTEKFLISSLTEYLATHRRVLNQ